MWTYRTGSSRAGWWASGVPRAPPWRRRRMPPSPPSTPVSSMRCPRPRRSVPCMPHLKLLLDGTDEPTEAEVRAALRGAARRH